MHGFSRLRTCMGSHGYRHALVRTVVNILGFRASHIDDYLRVRSQLQRCRPEREREPPLPYVRDRRNQTITRARFTAARQASSHYSAFEACSFGCVCGATQWPRPGGVGNRGVFELLFCFFFLQEAPVHLNPTISEPTNNKSSEAILQPGITVCV